MRAAKIFLYLIYTGMFVYLTGFFLYNAGIMGLMGTTTSTDAVTSWYLAAAVISGLTFIMSWYVRRYKKGLRVPIFLFWSVGTLLTTGMASANASNWGQAFSSSSDSSTFFWNFVQFWGEDMSMFSSIPGLLLIVAAGLLVMILGSRPLSAKKPTSGPKKPKESVKKTPEDKEESEEE